MNKYKYGTITKFYCDDATKLLSLFNKTSIKTFIRYGESGEFFNWHLLPESLKIFRIILIKRKGSEYYGFENLYNKAI